MFDRILDKVTKKVPLVHCITNYVTVNDCANVLLACGGSPVMADDIQEVCDITSISDALVLNIGTLNQNTIEAMRKAGKKANERNLPVILDPVGAGASKLRTDTTFRLMEEIKFAVIRGNISEIKTVSEKSNSTRGVDADTADMLKADQIEEAVRFAKDLSQRTGAVIAISGAIDIVSDSQKAYVIHNGHSTMAKITGTGCMLTAVIGAFCAACPTEVLDAAAAAVCAMGLSGELAYEKMTENDSGFASFKTYLIDYMGKMDGKMLKEGAKIECR